MQRLSGTLLAASIMSLLLMPAYGIAAFESAQTIYEASCRHPSLAFDPSNMAAVSFFVGSERSLRYGVYSGGSWTTEVVDNAVYDPQYDYDNTSLAFNPTTGLPAIAYIRETVEGNYWNGELCYAYHDGTDWHIETVKSLSGTDYCLNCSLAFDTAGVAYISYVYFNGASYKIYVANNSSGWSSTEVPTTGAYPGYYSGTSIGIHSSGNICVAYNQGMGGSDYDLYYSEYYSGAWHATAVDTDSTNVGAFARMRFSPADGEPAIVYYFGCEYDLRYAKRTGGTGGSWSHENVEESSSSTFYFPSLSFHVNSPYHPCISYCVMSPSYILSYAEYNGSTWNIQDLYDCNRYTSMEIHPTEDKPYIAYRSYSTGYLMFTKEQGPTSTPTITPTETETPTVTPQPTTTPTPTITPTPTATPIHTATPIPPTSTPGPPPVDPTSTPVPPTENPTATPTPALAVSTGDLLAGRNFSVTINLVADINEPFDYYLFVNTPFGPYTIYFNGQVKVGKIALYRNVLRYSAPYTLRVQPAVNIPPSMKGQEVTFATAAMKAGMPVPDTGSITPGSAGVLMGWTQKAVIQ